MLAGQRKTPMADTMLEFYVELVEVAEEIRSSDKSKKTSFCCGVKRPRGHPFDRRREPKRADKRGKDKSRTAGKFHICGRTHSCKALKKFL